LRELVLANAFDARTCAAKASLISIVSMSASAGSPRRAPARIGAEAHPRRIAARPRERARRAIGARPRPRALLHEDRAAPSVIRRTDGDAAASKYGFSFASA
jgi:hypothetical protein